jgi:carbamoyltransferase
MLILGISAFYHDSAACIVHDGEIIAAAQEERFTRIKHDESFPVNAVKFCLDFAGISPGELDYVVFYEKPFLKFERLLETYYAFAPKGFRSFAISIPIWIKNKLLIKKIIKDELHKISQFDSKKTPVLFSEHHLSHAASAFYPSPYEEAAIITIDGVGEWATASIGYGQQNTIKIFKELHFPHSVGLLYSAFTLFTGFRVNSGEYKLMGLAPYGNPVSPNVKRFISLIKEQFVDIKPDGSIKLNMDYFAFATGLKMLHPKKWEKLLGVPLRQPESPINQEHCDLAFAIQQITEEIVFNMAAEAKRLTGSANLCLSGGVALNCVANGKLLSSGIFQNIFIQPAAGDAGGSLGAALAVYHLFAQKERKSDNKQDGMKGALLGPDYTDKEIEIISKKLKARYTFYQSEDELLNTTATLISNGAVVGWFQGRMEFGPRALGNRSILADARNVEMQKKLNLKIKYRESFRPFAPSVLIEHSKEYFESGFASPYMLLIDYINQNHRNHLPDNYNDLFLKEKLYFVKSDISAITHLDFSARVQTVHQEINPKYWKLIQSFRKITGYGIIVNTSFNVRGEPIVCSPLDAYRCFMHTEMDYLVLNNFIFDKNDQPEFKDDCYYKEKIKPD